MEIKLLKNDDLIDEELDYKRQDLLNQKMDKISYMILDIMRYTNNPHGKKHAREFNALKEKAEELGFKYHKLDYDYSMDYLW